jgi:hypothetical protein
MSCPGPAEHHPTARIRCSAGRTRPSTRPFATPARFAHFPAGIRLSADSFAPVQRSAVAGSLRKVIPRNIRKRRADRIVPTNPRMFVIRCLTLTVRGSKYPQLRSLRSRVSRASRPAHLMGHLPTRPSPARSGPTGWRGRHLPEDVRHRGSVRPPAPSTGPAHIGRGEVAYQRNELDSALRQVTEGIALCRQFLCPAPLIVFLDLRVTTARQLLVDCFLAGFDGVVRYDAPHC